MTSQTDTDRAVEDYDLDDITDGLTGYEAEQWAEEIEIQTPEGAVPMSAVIADVLLAHQDLEDYKTASVSMTQAIKERRLEAEANNNETAAALLAELQDAAEGIYLRIQRGDAEITGDRDGKYSGYFENDDTGN